jgi:hypothetical protein
MNPYHPLVPSLQKKNKIMEENAVLLKPKYCRGIIKNVFTNTVCLYTFLFPWRKNLFVKIERMCGKLPLGAQYYVVGINKTSQSTELKQ